jgi:hypothetical protein
MMILTLLLFLSNSPEPIDKAFTGLVAEVEDDLGPDYPLQAIQTKGCKSKLIAKGKAWSVNWAKAEMVALEDTFVFIMAPRIKLAIVGDASKPDQRIKLEALYDAMMDKAGTCLKRKR